MKKRVPFIISIVQRFRKKGVILSMKNSVERVSFDFGERSYVFAHRDRVLSVAICRMSLSGQLNVEGLDCSWLHEVDDAFTFRHLVPQHLPQIPGAIVHTGNKVACLVFRDGVVL